MKHGEAVSDHRSAKTPFQAPCTQAKTKGSGVTAGASETKPSVANEAAVRIWMPTGVKFTPQRCPPEQRYSALRGGQNRFGPLLWWPMFLRHLRVNIHRAPTTYPVCRGWKRWSGAAHPKRLPFACRPAFKVRSLFKSLAGSDVLVVGGGLHLTSRNTLRFIAAGTQAR